MKIEMGKKYRTRGNEESGVESVEVRVLCIDAPGRYPVVSLTPNGTILTHTADGKCPGVPSLDLIETRERVRREHWCNVYADPGLSGIYADRAFANKYAVPGRIACVRVVIDCEVGEGLEEGQ